MKEDMCAYAKRTHRVPSKFFFFNSKIKTKHYHHQEQTLYIQTYYIKILEYQQIRENPNNFQRGNLKEGLEEDWYQIPHQQH